MDYSSSEHTELPSGIKADDYMSLPAQSFESHYPNIDRWINDHDGYIEIGSSYDSPYTSFIRGIDQGGMVVHGKDSYDTFEAAFQDLDIALAEALVKIYG